MPPAQFLHVGSLGGLGTVFRDVRFWRIAHTHQALGVDYRTSGDGGQQALRRERGVEETLDERFRRPYTGDRSGILSRHAEFGGPLCGSSLDDKAVIQSSCSVNIPEDSAECWRSFGGVNAAVGSSWFFFFTLCKHHSHIIISFVFCFVFVWVLIYSISFAVL